VLAGLTLAIAFPGTRIGALILGRNLGATPDLASYGSAVDAELDRLVYLREGRSAVVTLRRGDRVTVLQTNGQSEGGLDTAPPYVRVTPFLLGALPYLFVDNPERAAVIGLGAAGTLRALLFSEIETLDVIELEAGVESAIEVLYRGRPNPLRDPRVRLIVNDGRNELLGQTGRGEPRYDLIASQPSHPWVSGAANLFTREFMAVVRDRLSERGLFAMWINTFRADRDSLLAIAASFEEIFPGSFVFISNEQRGRTSSVMLIGGRSPLRVDAAAVRERMAASELGRALRLLHGFDGFEALMTLAEAPTSAYAQLAGELRNTDDNALVEMRAPRLALASGVDLEALESSLPADTPVLPPLGGSVAAADVAARILDLARGQQPWPFAHRLERLLRTAAQEIEPLQREVLAARIALGDEQRESAAIARLRDLADRYPERPEALRALGRHLFRAGRLAEAADALAPAYARAPSARAAYEVGRALEPQSLQGAREWYRRIPAEARSEFPRLAVSEARWALSEGAPAELLRPQLERLLAYRATREGRSEPDLGGLIAKLAHGVGDELLAARFEAPGARPVHPGWKAEFDAALSAFARRDVEATEQSLARARKLAPGNRPVLQLAAASAARRGDASALAATFASLRDYAPTLEAGIRAENEVRARIGMPLLPMLAAERSVESLRER
jgi:spermidine synthase/tetratricopeptide (TPR) repeat protein